MEKYPNAVIYRLKCYTNNTYYIGSTVDLRLRMNRHKCKKDNHTNSKNIIAGGNYGKPKILLPYPCNDIKELHKIEQVFLDTYREKYGDSVLNNYDAYLTEEEFREKDRKNSAKWRADNPDKAKETKAKYRAENSEKFNCACGGKYTKLNKPTHIKTKIHQKFIQNQNLTQKQVSEAHEG